MLKKRIIAVVNVLDGWAIQSFGYKKYLPLGKPECLVENLDRWGADEILLNVIDRSKKQLGPDLKLLKKIAKIGIGTPLIYSGGIRHLQDGKDVIQTGADRICVDSLIYTNLKQVQKLSEVIGVQGVIASLPVGIKNKKIYFYDHLNQERNLDVENIKKIIDNLIVSEILLIDYKSEGLKESFNETIINLFKNKKMPLIVFGGITEPNQINRILNLKQVSAIGIGNSLNYEENKIQKIKEAIKNSVVREENYQMAYKIDV